MRFYKVIEVAASGCMVYALAVACSGGGGGGGGLLPDAASAGFGGFLADVLLDPVSEAKAAPPEVKDAPCAGPVSGGYFAEVAFPGKSVNELAMAHALLHATAPANGYEWYQATSVSVKDGFVNVYCYSDTGGTPVVNGVRVVVPPP